MISLEHVTTSFGRRGQETVTAVNDVTLQIRRGVIHGIIGFSGAGKSTLLRNMNLLQRPSSGTVSVNDLELTALGPEQLRRARHQIGMIFQGFNLVHNLTALGNVELSLKFAGEKNRARRRERATEALEIVDLADRLTSYPAQLSGGQKQRVAIARALATRPQVLLCDEPTSALDPLTTASVLQYLADVNRELGITVVVVTHEMGVIKALTDEVTVMENGQAMEHFPSARLKDPHFSPRTAIGRYLLSDGITVDRSGHRNQPFPDPEAADSDRTGAAENSPTPIRPVGVA